MEDGRAKGVERSDGGGNTEGEAEAELERERGLRVERWTVDEIVE